MTLLVGCDERDDREEQREQRHEREQHPVRDRSRELRRTVTQVTGLRIQGGDADLPGADAREQGLTKRADAGEQGHMLEVSRSARQEAVCVLIGLTLRALRAFSPAS